MNILKQNIAEILIEKHRNGPVGKIDLYFDEKMSTFLEVDHNTASSNAGGIKTSQDSFGGIF